nr:immunoglobulin heavy chain junction region [Mus musculus]
CARTLYYYGNNYFDYW